MLKNQQQNNEEWKRRMEKEARRREVCEAPSSPPSSQTNFLFRSTDKNKRVSACGETPRDAPLTPVAAGALRMHVRGIQSDDMTASYRGKMTLICVLTF